MARKPKNMKKIQDKTTKEPKASDKFPDKGSNQDKGEKGAPAADSNQPSAPNQDDVLSRELVSPPKDITKNVLTVAFNVKMTVTITGQVRRYGEIIDGLSDILDHPLGPTLTRALFYTLYVLVGYHLRKDNTVTRSEQWSKTISGRSKIGIGVQEIPDNEKSFVTRVPFRSGDLSGSIDLSYEVNHTRRKPNTTLSDIWKTPLYPGPNTYAFDSVLKDFGVLYEMVSGVEHVRLLPSISD